ncbi:MAG: glutamine--tRNA ligase, partial [Chloroflexi bacterium]|nr:glutamine--tRNA ligase [Chloroflexota bacterium]
FMDDFDPDSKKVVMAKLEPSLGDAKIGEVFQFMRNGYFTLDSEDSKPGALVFNRTIGLVDSWAKTHKG